MDIVSLGKNPVSLEELLEDVDITKAELIEYLNANENIEKIKDGKTIKYKIKEK